MKSLVCVVDDDSNMNQAICTLVSKRDCEILSFKCADEFLTWFRTQERQCDLIISDINMPGSSGYDLCAEVRKVQSAVRIPIILVTGSDPLNEKTKGLEVGADDFIHKPFNSRELFAKVDSLLGIRASELNQEKKVGTLSRFVSPSVARMLTSDLPQENLKPHRVNVSVLFIDLRRFTAFAERAEPEEVMEVLGRYYTIVGDVVLRHNGTLGHLAGDGIMVFFNDPEPISNHQEVAVRAAVEIREALSKERVSWNCWNYDIDFGIGIAHGYATIGGIGFDRFWQYSVIGPVTNLAARLCQVADRGQIIVSERFLGRMGEDICHAETLGKIALKGISQPVHVFNVVSIRKALLQAA